MKMAPLQEYDENLKVAKQIGNRNCKHFERRNGNYEKGTFARVRRELEGDRLKRQGGLDGRSLWMHQSKHHDGVGDDGDDDGDDFGDDGDDDDCGHCDRSDM